MDREPVNEQIEQAVNLVITMTVSSIARQKNIPATQMLLEFMKSRTADVLCDTSTGFWCEGPAAAEAAYLREIEQ